MESARNFSSAARPLSILWISVSLLLCLSAWTIYDAPLFYIDTASYITQGDEILRSILSIFERLIPSNGGAEGKSSGAGDAIVIGSRSATYALFLSLANSIAGIGTAVVGQSALFVFVLWLSITVALRAHSTSETGSKQGPDIRLAGCRITALTVAAGCLGSLPFFTIYLMPDIFTSLLILIVAMLAMYGQAMRRWELAAAFLVGVASVTAHPSHLLIGALLAAGAAVVALTVRTRRAWIGLVLIAGILAAGLGERVVFTAAAKTVRKAEVVYLPFLTVRVIVDGPGLSYLADKCPSQQLATCRLYDMIKDNPARIHPSKMLFSRLPEDGSFALLDTETQKRIAREQAAFFADVVKTYPAGMVLAVARNTLTQIGYFSVIMNLPTEKTIRGMMAISDDLPASLRQLKLAGTPDWLPKINRLHHWIYWGSGLIAAALMLWPWRGPPLRLRCFALVVFGGVVANALVCGGISQPAERYGARVIFLLPMMAMVLLAFLPQLPGSPARKGSRLPPD